jgi:hypothetical protein
MDLHFHIETTDGRAEPTTFPSDLPLRQLIDAFVTDPRLRIQPPDPEFWQLFDDNTGAVLDAAKTLRQNGVDAGHLLKLQPRKAPPPPIPTGTVRGTTGSIALKRCENGHYYDPKKHTKCPFCGVPTINFNPFAGNPVAGRDSSPAVEHTQPYGYRPAAGTAGIGDDAITRGVRLVQDEGRIDPVVGWLIAVGGPEKGKDYRIRSENNFIGRSKDMHICISGDDLISREKHTVITFDPQRNAFHLSPGDGRGLVYLNGEALLAHKQLTAYDEILVGKTKLLFVPFCGDKFKWD